MICSRENVQVTILKSIEGENVLREEWGRLVFQMEVPQVFFTYEWALAAERAFAPLVKPRIVVVKAGDRTIGIAALASHGEKPHKAFFLGASTGDYCDFVSAPGDRNHIVMTVLGALRCAGVTDVELANIPKTSSTINALKESSSCGYHLASRVAYVCGRVAFGNSNDERHNLWGAVSHKQLEKRKLARMAKVAPVRLAHLRTTEQASQELDSLVNAQINRFLATGRCSPLLAPERRKFLQESATLMGQAGWLDISALKLGDRSIAWNFGFRFHSTLFWYLPTFDISAEEFSPGSCLLRLMIEEGCNDPQLSEIDLGLGDEGYKERFANAATTTLIAHLSASMATHLKKRSREAVVQGIRSFEPLEKSARHALALASKTKNVMRKRRPLGALTALSQKMSSTLASRQEAIFFEWNDGRESKDNQHSHLEPVTWSMLAHSARVHRDDHEMLGYLMRAAQRLRKYATGACSAWALVSATGEVMHFCWIADFNGFEVREIEQTLQSASDAAMIFDCWTPERARGSGNYGMAIASLAAEMKKRGRTAWIFSAAQNRASLRALQKSEFEFRYSLMRRKIVFRMPVEKLPVMTAQTRLP